MQKKQKKTIHPLGGVTLDTGRPPHQPPPPHAESAATLYPIIQFSLRLLQSAATCFAAMLSAFGSFLLQTAAQLEASSSYIWHSESNKRPELAGSS